MDACYVVTGYYSKNSPRITMYAGTSPERAFHFPQKFSLEAEIVIEIWENGSCVQELKQENIKNK